MTIYSGTRKQSSFLANEIGKIYRLKGYTSTTTDRGVAEGFLGNRLLVIKATSGKNLVKYSYANESEILLPRSTLVRLDKVELKTIKIFTEDGEYEDRQVEILYLTEVSNS